MSTSFNENDPPEHIAAVTHYILGDDNTGIAIAEQLQANGHQVATVNEGLSSPTVPTIDGDPSSVAVLSEAGIEPASTVIVATRSDRRNLLIAQLVRARFDVSCVVPLVHDPDRFSAFDEAGHKPLCVSTVLSEAVEEVV